MGNIVGSWLGPCRCVIREERSSNGTARQLSNSVSHDWTYPGSGVCSPGLAAGYVEHSSRIPPRKRSREQHTAAPDQRLNGQRFGPDRVCPGLYFEPVVLSPAGMEDEPRTETRDAGPGGPANARVHNSIRPFKKEFVRE